MMMEVEGDTESWCLRLLRHEMGHVLNHAYLFGKDKPGKNFLARRRWNIPKAFAPVPIASASCAISTATMPKATRRKTSPKPLPSGSLRTSTGRHQYEAGRRWKNSNTSTIDAAAGRQAAAGFLQSEDQRASRLRSRLEAHYKRRRRTYAQEFPDFFDADLKDFSPNPRSPHGERAAAFLRRANKLILNAVSASTGEPKFTISRLLRALTERCAELDLRLQGAIRRCRDRRLSGDPGVALSSDRQVQG